MSDQPDLLPEPPAGTAPPPGADTPVAVGIRPAGALSYRQARESPCLTCQSSPCCTYLLLRTMVVKDLTDLDYAMYLLNFEGVYLGFSQNGPIRVYLYQPCGHLDVASGLCGVHGTEAQPSICSHYSAYTCTYRKIMTVDVNPIGVLVDRRRLAWWADQLTFDDNRRLTATPDWDEVFQAFSALPLERHPAPPPPPDPVTEAWQAIALSGAPAGDGRRAAHYSDPTVSAPCRGCEAWCCTTLIFSRSVPETASQLDFFRYALGFPSVRVGVADDDWAIVVRSRCRHLDQGGCSVYGTEERPLRCGNYDALKCTYRVHFGTPQPEELVLIDLDQFPVLAGSMVFDDLGQVRAVPPVEDLRYLVEETARDQARARAGA